MFRSVLIVYRISVFLSSVSAQLDIALFSDSSCTQPVDQFLSANGMINDWNYLSSIPRSQVAINSSLATSDPDYCIPRTFTSFPYTGYLQVECYNATNDLPGVFWLNSGYNQSTACTWGMGYLVQYRVATPAGSIPGTGCYGGTLSTTWINNTWVNVYPPSSYKVYGRFSCTPRVLPPPASGSSTGTSGTMSNKHPCVAVVIVTWMIVFTLLVN